MDDMTKKVTTHKRDSDCTVGTDGVCEGCGAVHGDPCLECGGRGYHNLPCDVAYEEERLNTGRVFAEALELGLVDGCISCAVGGGEAVPCPNEDLGCAMVGCARCHAICCIELAVRRRK
jgi:hypothetical protein